MGGAFVEYVNARLCVVWSDGFDWLLLLVWIYILKGVPYFRECSGIHVFLLGLGLVRIERLLSTAYGGQLWLI